MSHSGYSLNKALQLYSKWVLNGHEKQLFIITSVNRKGRALYATIGPEVSPQIQHIRFHHILDVFPT